MTSSAQGVWNGANGTDLAINSTRDNGAGRPRGGPRQYGDMYMNNTRSYVKAYPSRGHPTQTFSSYDNRYWNAPVSHERRASFPYQSSQSSSRRSSPGKARSEESTGDGSSMARYRAAGTAPTNSIGSYGGNPNQSQSKNEAINVNVTRGEPILETPVYHQPNLNGLQIWERIRRRRRPANCFLWKVSPSPMKPEVAKTLTLEQMKTSLIGGEFPMTTLPDMTDARVLAAIQAYNPALK